jgi:uncharacterized membrane protein YhaH (DUF805 family)
MTFQDSIATCLRKYATFDGRASRSEFWWFMLFFLLAILIPSMVSDIAANIIALALLIPNLAVSARRLHDIQKSGWFLLLGLIPIIGSIILLVWSAKKSDPNDNEYGPVPADVAEGAVALPPGAV